MDLHHPIVESVVLPLLAGLVLTGLGRAVLGPARGGLAAALGVGLAILGATIWMRGLSTEPSSTLARLVWVLGVALVAGVAAGLAAARPFLAWSVGALALVGTLGWLGGLRGLLHGAIGAGVLAALLTAPAARADAVTALVVASLGLGAASFLAGSLALTQQALVIAAAAGGAALWLWPKARLSFGPGATVAATVAWFATAQSTSQGIDIGTVTVALLAAALLAALVTAGGRREPFSRVGGGGLRPSAAGRSALLRPLATAAIAIAVVAAGVGWQVQGVRSGQGAGQGQAGQGGPAAADDPYLK